jgi:lycopene cyclase domain-containing protein
MDFGRWTHLVYLAGFGSLILLILWLRHGRFLWSQRGVLLRVLGVVWLWTLITDPLGGAWGAWHFDRAKTLGIYLGAMPIEDMLGMTIVGLAAASAALVFGFTPRRFL